MMKIIEIVSFTFQVLCMCYLVWVIYRQRKLIDKLVAKIKKIGGDDEPVA